MPDRIKLERRKRWRKPAGAISVARRSDFAHPAATAQPGGSPVCGLVVPVHDL